MYELREGGSQRSTLYTWDVASQCKVSSACEFMESYELCCGPLQLDEAGHELVCGAVHHSALPLSTLTVLLRPG